jgi:hypothetical protein
MAERLQGTVDVFNLGRSMLGLVVPLGWPRALADDDADVAGFTAHIVAATHERRWGSVLKHVPHEGLCQLQACTLAPWRERWAAAELLQLPVIQGEWVGGCGVVHAQAVRVHVLGGLLAPPARNLSALI